MMFEIMIVYFSLDEWVSRGVSVLGKGLIWRYLNGKYGLVTVDKAIS